MKNTLTALATLLVLLLMTIPIAAAAAEPATPKPVDASTRFEAKTLQSQSVVDGRLNYRLLTPQGYDANADKTYPLMLFLHGAGERGTDNKGQLRHGGRELANDLQTAGACFVVAPQCPPGKQWVNTPWGKGNYSTNTVAISDELKMAIEAAEKTASEYRIDKSRIYVMGLSMGGFGTWDAIGRRPDLFAAAIPICGGGDPSAAGKIKTVAIWTFHGSADTTVPTRGTQEMVAALQKAGATDKTLKYEEFPGVGHNSWAPAWKTKGLFEWLMKQRKGE